MKKTEQFIIFLDIDGVLVSYDNLRRDEKGESVFKSEAVQALNQIISYYDADLCMISSWNVKFSTSESYGLFLAQRGIKINHLEFGYSLARSDFISSIIESGLISNYLIIDDEAEQYYKSDKIDYKRILQPNKYRCLDQFDVKQVTINYKLNSFL